MISDYERLRNKTWMLRQLTCDEHRRSMTQGAAVVIKDLCNQIDAIVARMEEQSRTKQEGTI